MILVLLSLLTAAVAGLRFNRADWLVGPFTMADGTVHLGDSRYYVETVRWLSGEMDDVIAGQEETDTKFDRLGIASNIQGIRAPFCYRLVVPALAAALPLSPMTAINAVNVLLVVGAMLLLYRLQRLLALSERDALFGSALFAVSFPTFYYSTIGYVDPVVVFAVTACLNLIYGRHYLAAALVIGFGLLAKENIVMVVPALAAGVWVTTRSWRPTGAWTILALGLWTALWLRCGVGCRPFIITVGTWTSPRCSTTSSAPVRGSRCCCALRPSPRRSCCGGCPRHCPTCDVAPMNRSGCRCGRASPLPSPTTGIPGSWRIPTAACSGRSSASRFPSPST